MKRRTLLAIVTLLILSTLSCNFLGGGGDEESTDIPPAPTKAAAEAPTSPPEAVIPEEPALPETEKPRVRPADAMTMLHVPSGEFLMGDDTSPYAPEKPTHTVYLDEYWIDQTEVTNAQYRACFEAGVCSEAAVWSNEELDGDRQPVLVSWQAATTYCEWVDTRLPTEAEWEKAVRGTDGRKWPWGNEFEDNRANLNGDEDGYGATAPVGSFPGDASPYGLLDAVGNAGEWVSDWFDAEYYSHSPAQNPTGPGSGEQKVHRAPIANGGGGPEKSRCAARYGVDPSSEYGFRCVSATAPTGEAEPPAPAETTPETSAEQATPGPPTEQATPAGKVATPATFGDTGGSADTPVLNSYREVNVMREGGPDGPIQIEFTAEWDAETSSSHTVIRNAEMATIEEITIGQTRWMRMGDNPWIEQTLTPEEQATWASKISLAQLWGDASEVEADLETTLPEGVELVAAQMFPLDIKAALVFDGEETVNDVHCKRYTVDTDLDYTLDIPGGGEMHYSGHATGAIWVAEQSGIPHVIVRAWMDEDLLIDGEENHSYWEHDITNINETITIEAPE